jgi:hypothetical protein
MADPPKRPEETRPQPPVRDVTSPIETEKTVPMRGGVPESTRPTQSITRPTVVYPKSATRPVPSVGKSPTGVRTPIAKPPSATRTATVKSPTATKTPALRRTGSVSRVSQTNPAVPMTEGMRARRREIERKKRRAALERMRMEAELGEGWRRIFKTTGAILLVLALGYGYWRIQQLYGNNWPIMAVWVLMALFILTAFGWILWYMNKSDI